jgi:chorismate mutase/prephenate dehydrogenase
MVDSLDHELLQVAARRMAVVAEIAAYKRQHHLRIRDPQREREILEDRCRRAEEMGLPRGEIESLFRVLLRASRDHQAALRTELPVESDALTIAIIGGRGSMGRVLDRMFGDLGHRVIVSDHQTELTPGDAAAMADVTIISVPIDVTEQVIREVAPRVRPDALLMDVTSVKSDPVRLMLESTTASVLGTHPMFGPSVHSLQGQRVVLGNLYVNRKITGALVGRQPFGGFRHSGMGHKAGGPDTLSAFVTSRTITENTLRRGFAPE